MCDEDKHEGRSLESVLKLVIIRFSGRGSHCTCIVVDSGTVINPCSLAAVPKSGFLKAPVAQWIERWTSNPKAASSILAGGTLLRFDERGSSGLFHYIAVPGFSPAFGTCSVAGSTRFVFLSYTEDRGR